jgi:hypothetical protein
MKRHAFVVSTLSLLLVLALVSPALAGTEEVTMVLAGTMKVGDSIGGGAIPQSGQCTPTGKGLHAPGRHGAGKNKAAAIVNGVPTQVVVNKEVYYRLNVPNANVDITDTNDELNNGLYQGPLDICGIISPGPAGIGAACGSWTGRNGKGKLIVTRSVPPPPITYIYDIQDFGWPPTVGGVLVVHGHITRVSANKLTKFTSKGSLKGKLTVVLPLDCLTPKPGGAKEFVVTGKLLGSALQKPAQKPREPKLPK